MIPARVALCEVIITRHDVAMIPARGARGEVSIVDILILKLIIDSN